MKKFIIGIFIIILISALGFTVKIFNDEKKAEIENFQQAFELNSEEIISKMYVGIGGTPVGWDYDTEDKEQINMALNLLKKQVYVKQDNLGTTNELGSFSFYRFYFDVKDSHKTINASIDPSMNIIEISIYDKSTISNIIKYYSFPNNTSTEFKELFDIFDTLKKGVSL